MVQVGDPARALRDTLFKTELENTALRMKIAERDKILSTLQGASSSEEGDLRDTLGVLYRLIHEHQGFLNRMRHERLDYSQPLVWTVPGFLDEEQCDLLLMRLRKGKSEEGTIRTASGDVTSRETRNNKRYVVDNPWQANELFKLAQRHLPRFISGWERSSASERIRLYEYGPGEYFKPHMDGSYKKSPTERSLVTFMIYLNEDFEGGATVFDDIGRRIEPKRGTALFFQHRLLHESETLVSGIKRAVRLDIMYKKIRGFYD